MTERTSPKDAETGEPQSRRYQVDSVGTLTVRASSVEIVPITKEMEDTLENRRRFVEQARDGGLKVETKDGRLIISGNTFEDIDFPSDTTVTGVDGTVDTAYRMLVTRDVIAATKDDDGAWHVVLVDPDGLDLNDPDVMMRLYDVSPTSGEQSLPE